MKEMKSNHSNKLKQYENLFVLGLSGAAIVGFSVLLVPIYGLDVLEEIFSQIWIVVIIALVAGIGSGILRWRYVQHWFVQGLVGLLNVIIAYLMGMAMVRYFQLPNATLVGWFVMIQLIPHLLVQPTSTE